MNNLQPHQFKDLTGEVWTISIDVGLYLELSSKHGINLSEVFSQDSSWLQDLAGQENALKLIEVLTLCTDRERESRGLSLEDFHARLDGDVLGHMARCFAEAAVVFLPAHKREAMRMIIKAVYTGMESAGAKVAKKAEEEMPKILDELSEAMDQKINDLLE